MRWPGRSVTAETRSDSGRTSSPLMGADPERARYWDEVRAHHDAQVSGAEALVEQVLRRLRGPVEVRVQGALGIQERDDSPDSGPGQDTLVISIQSEPRS